MVQGVQDSNSLCIQQSRAVFVTVLTGHLTDDGVEIGLILVVDESIMEYPLTLMAEETENLVLISHLTWLTLQYA